MFISHSTSQFSKIWPLGLGWSKNNTFKDLELNQNTVLRIILNKKTLEGSTKNNYALLGVLLLLR